HRRQHRLEALVAVGHQHGDAVAGMQAERAQRVRETVGARLGLAKRDPGLTGDPRRALAVALGRTRQQLADVHQVLAFSSAVTQASTSAASAALSAMLPKRTR